MTMLAQFAAAGGGALPAYIEDVFSTYLYTGTNANRSITNGIDLAGEGGLVWVKNRTGGPYNHMVFDSTRLPSQYLHTNTTDANQTNIYQLTSFNANGFSLGDGNLTNGSGETFASWTFRKQPKFFDVVTYTGTGSNRTIAHNLGSVPGCIIVKTTSQADNWFVQHRSLGATKYIALNDADIAYTNSQLWNNTEPTSTVFTLGTNSGVNQSGQTYVAYLFAHDAGGFGLSGTENVVSCGTYTTDGSGNATVTLGYEPQWLMVKASNAGQNWLLFDVMRGMYTGGSSYLNPNTTDAETAVTTGGIVAPTATGFTFGGGSISTSSTPYIYIAIRRGPMKVPTDGTKVFKPAIRTGTSASATITGVGFPPDLVTSQDRGATGTQPSWQDRLRGTNTNLRTNSTAAETSPTQTLMSFDMDGATLGTAVEWNYSGEPFVNYFFRRAPSFFDEVCFTLPGATTATYSHNLAVAPELMIVKPRGTTGNWYVYHKDLGTSAVLYLSGNFAAGTGSDYWSTTPTATQFSLNNATLWGNTTTSVAYLFATCAGVSKVGGYTGTGTTQVINCGFTTGARFVLIKRTDSTGDWYVWDSARGIVAGNDPYLLWNNNNPEVTGTDYVDTSATGFELTSTAPAAINASGGSYIFLAVA